MPKQETEDYDEEMETEIPQGFYSIWRKRDSGSGMQTLKAIKFEGDTKEDLIETIGEKYGDGSYTLKCQSRDLKLKVDVVSYGNKDLQKPEGNPYGTGETPQPKPSAEVQRPAQQQAQTSLSDLKQMAVDGFQTALITQLTNAMTSGKMNVVEAVKTFQSLEDRPKDPSQIKKDFLEEMKTYKELFGGNNHGGSLKDKLEEMALIQDVLGGKEKGSTWADLVKDIVKEIPSALGNVAKIQENTLRIRKVETEQLKTKKPIIKQETAQMEKPQIYNRKDILDDIVGSLKPNYNEIGIQKLSFAVGTEYDLFPIIKPYFDNLTEAQIEDVATLYDNNVFTAEEFISRLNQSGMPRFATIFSSDKGKIAIEKLIKKIDIYLFGDQKDENSGKPSNPTEQQDITEGDTQDTSSGDGSPDLE